VEWSGGEHSSTSASNLIAPHYSSGYGKRL